MSPAPPSAIPTLDDLDPAGKRVLVRVDFNVPLSEGQVGDDLRLQAALPTIRELLERGAALILMSHLGRPKGVDEALRMRPVGARLAQLLGREVRVADAVVGPAVSAAAAVLAPGEVLLLENLRFEPGEKANDPALGAALAALAEAYVDDAFGTAHRAAASTVGVTEHLPAYAGRLMQRELAMLGEVVAAPERPFVVLLGGAKVSDKVGVIDALLPRCDRILVGGGMANTFLAAADVPMGDSLVEESALEEARRIAALAGEALLLPVDLVVADAFAADAATRTMSLAWTDPSRAVGSGAADHSTEALGADDAAPAPVGVPAGWRALDIGPATLARFEAALAGARTVVWNGPMGVFELPPFARGTFALAERLAALEQATTIVGGGDSAAAVRQAGLADRVDWVSTGGGASLELLEGKALPAVEALRG